MRIIGGSLKGRTLLEFSKIGIRPTSDRVRESLFNILQNRIMGAKFLDLFSGTGAVGIEALSRGASSVTLNDNSKDSINLINKNLEKNNVKDFFKVTNCDALDFIGRSTEKFDIIYIDPPYQSGLEEQILSTVDKILAEKGIIVYETEKGFKSCDNSVLKIKDERKYGRAYLTFFERA